MKYSKIIILLLLHLKLIAQPDIKRIPAVSHFKFPWNETMNYHTIINDSTIIYGKQTQIPPYRLISAEFIDIKTGKSFERKKIDRGLKLTNFAFQDITSQLTIGEKVQTLKDGLYFNIYDLYSEKLLQSIRLKSSFGGNAAFNRPKAAFNKTFPIIMHQKNGYVLYPTDAGTLIIRDSDDGDIIAENFLNSNIDKFNFYYSLSGNSYFAVYAKFKKNTNLNSIDLKLGFSEFIINEKEIKVDYILNDETLSLLESKKGNLNAIITSIDDNLRIILYQDEMAIFERQNEYSFKFKKLLSLKGQLLFATSIFNAENSNSGGINQIAAISKDNRYLVSKDIKKEDPDGTDIIAIVDLENGIYLGAFKDFYTGNLTSSDAPANILTAMIKKKDRENMSEVVNGVCNFNRIEFTDDGKYLLGFNGAYNFYNLLKEIKE